jgi:hypothetical protein
VQVELEVNVAAWRVQTRPVHRTVRVAGIGVRLGDEDGGLDAVRACILVIRLPRVVRNDHGCPTSARLIRDPEWLVEFEADAIVPESDAFRATRA